MLKHEIQVGSSKKDTHSFVFSYKERRNQDDDDGGEEEEEVPDFFALTFPCEYEFDAGISFDLGYIEVDTGAYFD